MFTRASYMATDHELPPSFHYIMAHWSRRCDAAPYVCSIQIDQVSRVERSEVRAMPGHDTFQLRRYTCIDTAQRSSSTGFKRIFYPFFAVDFTFWISPCPSLRLSKLIYHHVTRLHSVSFGKKCGLRRRQPSVFRCKPQSRLTSSCCRLLTAGSLSVIVIVKPRVPHTADLCLM